MDSNNNHLTGIGIFLDRLLIILTINAKSRTIPIVVSTFQESRDTLQEILQDFRSTKAVPTQADRTTQVTSEATSEEDSHPTIRVMAMHKDLVLTAREVFRNFRIPVSLANTEAVRHHQEAHPTVRPEVAHQAAHQEAHPTFLRVHGEAHQVVHGDPQVQAEVHQAEVHQVIREEEVHQTPTILSEETIPTWECPSSVECAVCTTTRWQTRTRILRKVKSVDGVDRLRFRIRKCLKLQLQSLMARTISIVS